VDVVGASFTSYFPSVSDRGTHALFDLGISGLMGLAMDALAGGLAATKRPRLSLAVFAICVALVLDWVMDRIFVRQADALLDGALVLPLRSSFTVGLVVGVGAAIVLGRSVGAARHRWAPLLIVPALGTLVGNLLLYRDDYVEGHTTAVVAATLGLGAFFSSKLEGRSVPRRRAWLLTAGVVILGCYPTPNAVRLRLFESPGSAGAWLAANTIWRLPDLDGEPDPNIDPRWLQPREGERSPSMLRPPPAAPVVVLVTIDATRRDAVLGEERALRLKNLGRMMKEGTVFTEARSPGSQTAVSLAALFSGKYFSELVWSKHGSGKTRFDYPAADDSLRFVERLDERGVSTFKVVSLTFLRNDFGVARGFREEQVVTEGRRHARGREVLDPIVKRLESTRSDEPLFVFGHLTEPHAPYDRGKKRSGSNWERYLSEVELADELLGRVMTVLSRGHLAERALLIVSSDHGEAFGEHGTYEHTKTIYEEQLRVPLLFWGAGVKAQRVAEPVNLVDLGPTMLDWFGADTPDSMAGESLLPIVLEGPQRLSRPLFAEGRLRRAIFAGDLKVIVDERRKTVEAFDLAADPGELTNLYESDPDRVRPALAALHRYFEQRSASRDGYRPIYKP
jgi:hypothetical protein